MKRLNENLSSDVKTLLEQLENVSRADLGITFDSYKISEVESDVQVLENDIEIDKAKVETLADSNENINRKIVSYICRTDVINNLGFSARCVSFGIRNISWQPGEGWSVYNEICPKNQFGQSMYFKNAKVHQIIPIFGGLYWVGCNPIAYGCGGVVAPVQFAVNDDKYNDNKGSFIVDIFGWSL